jgi:hypothetical protein
VHPIFHLGLKPKTISENPLKRVQESSSFNLLWQVLTDSLGFQPQVNECDVKKSISEFQDEWGCAVFFFWFGNSIYIAVE